MPSRSGRVSRLKDACRAHIILEIIHVFINVHHVVLLSSFAIPINKIFFKTLLKCHGCIPTSPSPMPLSTGIARWGVNGANIEITSICAYMRRNLTWLDKTHAFTVWEGCKDRGYMSCLHNLWDRPCFHQGSSCSVIVIINHSQQWNRCRNYLEMSWNVF